MQVVIQNICGLMFHVDMLQGSRATRVTRATRAIRATRARRATRAIRAKMAIRATRAKWTTSLVWSDLFRTVKDGLVEIGFT